MGRQILLIEDDLETRKILAQILLDEGYGVALCSNGKEALDLLRQGGDFSVILLDLRMPILDGWEFRRIQTADPRLSRIPVIALSADSQIEQPGVAFDRVVRKPPDLDVLFDHLMKVFSEADQEKVSGRDESAREPVRES